MKKLQILLCALFLMMCATVAGAGEAGLPEVETQAAVEAPAPLAVQPADEPTDEAQTEAKPECDAPDGLFQSEWKQGVAFNNSCGSCSSSNCRGAYRGQPCWTGSGWGNCNIYSGGFICSSGGWECSCASGPLP